MYCYHLSCRCIAHTILPHKKVTCAYNAGPGCLFLVLRVPANILVYSCLIKFPPARSSLREAHDVVHTCHVFPMLGRSEVAWYTGQCTLCIMCFDYVCCSKCRHSITRCVRCHCYTTNFRIDLIYNLIVQLIVIACKCGLQITVVTVINSVLCNWYSISEY